MLQPLLKRSYGDSTEAVELEVALLVFWYKWSPPRQLVWGDHLYKIVIAFGTNGPPLITHYFVVLILYGFILKKAMTIWYNWSPPDQLSRGDHLYQNTSNEYSKFYNLLINHKRRMFPCKFDSH